MQYYETTERSFWKELALCNQHEFQNSGTEEKCIEARPEFDMGMEEYDKLQEIYRQLIKQELAVLTCEKK